jgi:hypothetical protein
MNSFTAKSLGLAEIYREFKVQEKNLSEIYIKYNQVEKQFRKISNKTKVSLPILLKRLDSNERQIGYQIEGISRNLNEIIEDLTIIQKRK